LPVLVFVFYRLLSWSWRASVEEHPELRSLLEARLPVIFAHWHGDELVLLSLVKRYRIATITSTSKDGELMDKVLGWLGAATSRGSSTRGGSNALRGLISLCKRGGNNISMAVDGPKGPIYKVKPGVFELSRLLDAPIYTASVSASRSWIFRRSWNKAMLPKFFARVHVRLEPALPVIARGVDPRDESLAQDLEEKLNIGRSLQNQKAGYERH
jgi:lysophospholipid acyltransferase (LPLAT)-like uncharacterized protein